MTSAEHVICTVNTLKHWKWEEKHVTCADTTNIIKQFVNGLASQSLQFVKSLKSQQSPKTEKTVRCGPLRQNIQSYSEKLKKENCLRNNEF